jgi:ribosomal protein S18 acetylase RimI-like enzyme
LIHDLAISQGVGDEMGASEADLRRDGFGPEPRFHAMLAFLDDAPAGLALYFFTYSTWRGRRLLYVEDLIVDQKTRGAGIGRALLAHLARIAVAQNCARLELEVRVDNVARGFYERLGLRHKESLLPYAIGGADLEKLAGSAVSG